MIEITEVSYADIIDTLTPLFLKHWEECGEVEGPDDLTLNHRLYYYMSLSNRLVALIATADSELVGYVGAFINDSPHHKGHTYGCYDAIYVCPSHRNGRVSRLLIDAMEDALIERGVSSIRIPSNSNRPIGPLLRRRGYKESEVIYQKYVKED